MYDKDVYFTCIKLRLEVDILESKVANKRLEVSFF